jgi:hypothetical protein
MSSTQTSINNNERRNIVLANGIIIEQDKRSRRYIIWSNIAYGAIVFAAIAYIILLAKARKTSPEKYLYKYRNEIFFLVVLIIYTIITLVNSMYYHDCGGSFNTTNAVCPLFEGKGYDFDIVSKNDYLFSGLTMLLSVLLLVRKFNGRTIKFFIALIANIYMISVLSFTKLDNNMIYANFIFGLLSIVCFYLTFKEIKNSSDNNKIYRIILLILLVISTITTFTLFSVKPNDYNTDDIDKLKENVRKDNVLHGTWHVMGAVSALLIVLYKIFDIKQFTNSK